ncbi:hypothetical protein DL93DRAFT_2078954 [Clavulina sp. PMI_390]|nr:hypothetical protein DL93DRAFT_2078954 [Clavulina sp. PMI_390]
MAFLNQAEPLLSGPGGAVLNLASIMYYNNIIYDGEGEPLYWIEPDGGKIFHRLIHIYRRATPSHQQPSMDCDSSDSDSIIVSDAQAESESAPSERVEVAYLQLHGLGRSKILYKGETRPLGDLLPRKGAMRR